MLSFLNKYGYNAHSQNCEDGVIQECVKRLGLTTGFAVETGSHDGLWLSNIRLLLEQGWGGLYIEGDYDLFLQCKQNWAHNPRVRSQCCYVDERNINAFVDERCDLLSLDTDGGDYPIFDGLKIKPKIVIVEIDSSLNPDFASFNSDGGANYFAMTLLGITKGYFLLCHTGNLLLLRNDLRGLFPDIIGDGITNADLYFNTAWLMN